MADSVFTKIIKGEIPSHKIYEDERTLAILDIHPVQPGHVLVVPKAEIDHVWDLSNEDYRALMDTVKKVGTHLKEQFPDKKRVSVQIEGLDISHAHVKLIPINSADDFRKLPDFDSEPDHDALKKMAEKLRMQ